MKSPKIIIEDSVIEGILKELDEEATKMPAEVKAGAPKAPEVDVSTEVTSSIATAVALPTTSTVIAASTTKTTPKDPLMTSCGLNEFFDVKKFRSEHADIKDTDLDKCMTEQSSIRAYYGELIGRAEYQESTCKSYKDVLESKLSLEIRQNLTIKGEKFTEKTVEALIKTNELWQLADERVRESERIATVHKWAMTAISDRLAMLIQKAADRREGMKGAVRMYEKSDAPTLDAKTIARAAAAFAMSN